MKSPPKLRLLIITDRIKIHNNNRIKIFSVKYMKLLIFLGNTLILIQPWAKTLAPFIAGFALFAASQTDKTKGIWLHLGLLCSFICIGTWGAFNYLVQPKFSGQVDPFPGYDMFLSSLFLVGGLSTYFLWLREGQPWWDARTEQLTKKTRLERNQKTDVRNIQDFLPEPAGQYDPTKYFKSEGYFLGLGKDNKPVYFKEDRLPHVQVNGFSGSGKSIFLSILSAQCLLKGQAVIYLDPKLDEFAPHSMAEAARRAGVPFVLLNLNTLCPQINMFEGTTIGQRKELWEGGFALTEKGGAADFYSIDDREAADKCASEYVEGDTPASLFNRFNTEFSVIAKKFNGLLREMAKLPSVNAKSGIDLRKIIQDGGAVYIIGSMRNTAVVRMQRMLLIKIIQLCEERDRTISKPRPVVAFLDEAKYHISKPFMEGLGAARDKGLSVVVAHQSLQDLRDCPADLNADAVQGAVMENCRLKLVYKAEDPKTAKWLAEKSGRIQVDDEMRRVSRNAAMSEVIDDQRTIRQAERFLIDENMIMNLAYGQAVVFGNGLPDFVSTSPIPVEKNPQDLKTQAFEGTEIIKAAELI